MRLLARCICAWLLATGIAAAQDRHLHDYTLRHALPEQVLPALRAQLSAGSSAVPYNQRLILNVTDDEYHNVLQLLEQLDVAARSLLISVRKQGRQTGQQQHYEVDGSIGSGAVHVDNGNGEIDSGREVLTPDGWQRSDGTRVVINHTDTRSDTSGSQQVRAVEGMRAFISTGTVLPVRSGTYGEQTLTPVENGFYATARIVGDEVVIDIDQRDDRVQGRDITTQSLQTQVRGRIGAWIPLGGIDDAHTSSERSFGGYRSDTGATAGDLSIRVDLAN